FVSRIYFCFLGRRPPCSPLFPYTTLFRSYNEKAGTVDIDIYANRQPDDFMHSIEQVTEGSLPGESTFGMPAMGSLSPSVMAKTIDRKSTRLNSSHLVNSYAVFCLKKKKAN